jgi:hypothetical protein
MGFLKKLFFGEEKPKTAMEKKVEEQIRENPQQYQQAQVTNIPTCNGCGQDIEGVPRLQKHDGKMMYFHKRCWKALKRGQLPKPIPQNETQQQEETQ